MEIVCLDLEGVLVPEIWINVAKKTGIDELRLTTRDISDYDVLMKKRLKILAEHKIVINDIQTVIRDMGPLQGANEFLEWLRGRSQVIILSDTFYEFAAPLMKQLGNPTLLCHKLDIDTNGNVVGYILRQKDAKRQSVKALQSLNFQVIAVGDSYNDTTMLTQADAGILFRPPDNVIKEFPEFPVTNDYESLKNELIKAQEELRLLKSP
jgi:phosphoserine/homoserine phosphotransferase